MKAKGKRQKAKFLFIIFSLYIVYSILYAHHTHRVNAVSPTPQVIPLNEKLNNQINDLKERIASRVAQLKLVERRGIIGTVTDISNTQITLSDLKDETRFVDVDELTKFSSSSSKDFGISDIGKETKLGILGLYNRESKRLLARFIEVVSTPKFYHGVITSVNDKNFTLTISLTDNKQVTTDIENTTKTFLFTKANGLTKSGFSKIEMSTRILVVGFPDKKDKDKIIATRVILFPELPKNPAISAVSAPTKEPTPTEEPTPTGGKKK